MVEVGKTYNVRAFGAQDATEFDTKVAITALDREHGAMGYLGIVRGEEIVPQGVVDGAGSTVTAIGRTSKLAVTGLGAFFSRTGIQRHVHQRVRRRRRTDGGYDTRDGHHRRRTRSGQRS